MKLIFILFCLFFFFPVTSVSAHVLETDGSIGAVLHMDPADDPVVGDETTFHFTLKDKEHKFARESCDCLLIISADGKQLFSSPVEKDRLQASYRFPKKGVYEVSLQGKSKEGNTFQPFHLRWDVRVARGEDKSIGQENPLKQDLIAIFIIALLMIGVVVYLIKINQTKNNAS